MSGLTIPAQINMSPEGGAPAATPMVSVPASGLSVALPPVAAPLTAPEDARHQARIQALTRQVQSGNYAPKPADVAAAWLKMVR
ncbi:MAG: hypothetical protein ACYCSH_05405 [Acidithiobacillus sp.]